ncbi:hydroxymethylglutaryl-CoA lyase [Peristeroidobacter soli]|uniref:hydroxymethylglutaryl-CoA lyase n=1 Tax=Peristeroidobacter soli TaxID=2497877 RepID=UPI00101BB614|nr:hydroxymethylglutaryl-CoA lyase [Peristeroidobacter soli]
MSNAAGSRVFIQEVAVRDGFQIEQRFVPTEEKIALIDRLSRCGLSKIEVTSFSSPKAIPMLADAEAVMRGIERVEGVEYAALVPNLRGCERALSCNVDEINLVMSASESHNRANLAMGCDDSLGQFARIVPLARAHAAVNASLSTAFGCPFEGIVPKRRVLELVARFVDMGIARVSLCDTTGMANPAQVEDIFGAVLRQWPELQVTAHFHNTRGMGLANAAAALRVGVNYFDASLGGLGGCPFAPGATGNVCTEDLVHMFDSMGWNTGVDLIRLLGVAAGLPALVGHDIPGQVLKAGPWTRRYPLPANVCTGTPA